VTNSSAMSPEESPSDGALVERAREGDVDAFGELWTRHADAALRAASQFRSVADPDDLVAEAYARILQAIRNGKGPSGAFRPYLFVTVRNLASRIATTDREDAVDDLDRVPDESTLADPAIVALDRSLTARAFRSLPDRWQTVLWYTVVEGMSPLEASTLVGLSANATAALSLRAREGLRQAWIQAHINDDSASLECKWMLTRMGRYARHDLSKRDMARATRHLAGCTRCLIVSEEIEDLGSRLAIVVLPLALGGAAGTAYLASLHASNGLAQAGVSAAAAGQGAVVAGGASVAAGGASGWLVGAGIAATLVIGGGTWAALSVLAPAPDDDAPVVAESGTDTMPTLPSGPEQSVPDPQPAPADPVVETPAPLPAPAPPPVPVAATPPAVVPAEPETPTGPADPVDPDVSASPPVLSSPLPADDSPTVPRLTGTAEPGATVTVTDQDDAVVTSVVADDAGGWDTGPLVGLPPTTTSLALRQEDVAGNLSEPAVIGPFAFRPTLAVPTETMSATAGVPFELDLLGWAGESISIEIDGLDYPGSWIFDSAGKQTRYVTLGAPGTYAVTFRYLGADPATDTVLTVTAD